MRCDAAARGKSRRGPIGGDGMGQQTNDNGNGNGHSPRKKKASTNGKSNGKTKRGVGRPRKSDRVVTPEVLRKINDMWCENVPVIEIGNRLGLGSTTVQYHIDRTLLPVWRKELVVGAEVELAKIGHIERIMWERWLVSQDPQSRESIKMALMEGGSDLEVVERAKVLTKRTGEVSWLHVIQWCIEQRCKICGHYAPEKFEIDGKIEYRVAGGSPSEVNEKMAAKLADLVSERKNYDQALSQWN